MFLSCHSRSDPVFSLFPEELSSVTKEELDKKSYLLLTLLSFIALRQSQKLWSPLLRRPPRLLLLNPERHRSELLKCRKNQRKQILFSIIFSQRTDGSPFVSFINKTTNKHISNMQETLALFYSISILSPNNEQILIVSCHNRLLFACFLLILFIHSSEFITRFPNLLRSIINFEDRSRVVAHVQIVGTGPHLCPRYYEIFPYCNTVLVCEEEVISSLRQLVGPQDVV